MYNQLETSIIAFCYKVYLFQVVKNLASEWVMEESGKVPVRGNRLS